MTKKHFDEDFKKQLVKIYNQGNHSYRSLSEEYGVSALTIKTWVIRYNDSKSFNLDDNRTEEGKELIELRKKLKQLEMENDICLKDKFHYGNKLPSESLKSKLYYYSAKVDLVISNQEKYSISAMCKFLQVARSLTYHHLNKVISIDSSEESVITDHIKSIFKLSRNNYGTRKIKKELERLDYQVSRRRISRIMKENALVSNYTVAKYKVHIASCNESTIANIVDRQFDNRDKLEVTVSDLTYVRVGGKWNYVCTIIDLHNREIIGYSAGPNKDAELVETALLRCAYSLQDIRVFHSDRGNEYDNILSTFKIDRSLSRKGNPYDNAVSEATNKSLKIEFIYQHKFETLEQLQLQLAEHIYWYNNLRIHESLDYMTPVEYRALNTMKLGKVS